MQIDTRSFKPRHSSAFLSMLHHQKITTKREIARAYFAGANPKELAQEYGISVQKVVSIAQWFDRERTVARRRAVVAPPPIIPDPEPVIEPVRLQAGNTYVVEKYDYTQPSGCRAQRITLPLLSIQR